MIRAARVSLKLHRFEIALALLAVLALGIWAVTVIARLSGLNVTQACLDAWVAAPGEFAHGCAAPLRAWGNLLETEGARLVGAMSIAPFAVGLLGGVPIVARELEARTAQMAWSLEPSRLRWLSGRLAPVVLLLGAALLFAGAASGIVERDREIWGEPAVLHIGEHGLSVIPRAFAALGIGLLVGALIGRSLPAFVMSVVLCYGAVQGAGMIRDAWLAAQPAGVILDATSQVQTGWAWKSPDGRLISEAQALGLVPPDVTTRDEGLAQAVNAIGWLEEHGFASVATGLSRESALGWVPYDAVIFMTLGLTASAAAAAVVSRRRPQ